MIVSSSSSCHTIDSKMRLIECFSAVFPSLSREEIASATQTSWPAWDSLANVTLVNLIEDEFQIEIPTEAMENLVSFDTLLSYLADCDVKPPK